MTDLTSSYLYAVVWQYKRNRLALAGGCVVLQLLFVVSSAGNPHHLVNLWCGLVL